MRGASETLALLDFQNEFGQEFVDKANQIFPKVSGLSFNILEMVNNGVEVGNNKIDHINSSLKHSGLTPD